MHICRVGKCKKMLILFVSVECFPFHSSSHVTHSCWQGAYVRIYPIIEWRRCILCRNCTIDVIFFCVNKTLRSTDLKKGGRGIWTADMAVNNKWKKREKYVKLRLCVCVCVHASSWMTDILISEICFLRLAMPAYNEFIFFIKSDVQRCTWTILWIHFTLQSIRFVCNRCLRTIEQACTMMLPASSLSILLQTIKKIRRNLIFETKNTLYSNKMVQHSFPIFS